MTTGRPKNPNKKRKLHVCVDFEVYKYLQSLENKSEFINKAAWILLKAYQKAGSVNG